ncbi:hypothetical protein [Chryseobacterium sp. Leaf394]|uniref:hypothetical protein n=1 Tax=Chryseobacterium sp. Leaf394 TaxID=1736361 RepID=UPI0006FF1CE3|nr:hypothetical protein [Chryseobacterium sp. Leaf394]KQS92668.1 hypothetical protein ASG21_09585 [Chryseobacterium sp. Leaf394]
MTESGQKKLPIFAFFIALIVKIFFLLTHHIQEDAFITWRVAQNLMDYGVMGFNGVTKISSSTTHLYVFVSYFFNLIFGKENFIEPLMIFNSILFTIGSVLLSHLFFKDNKNKAIFIVLFGLLPPSIKISILGMEYGILFFLEMALLYYGFKKEKKWAVLLLPALIMFTRIDTVIFLGITFLVDLIWTKKIRWNYIFGGIIALAVSLTFNWFYFGEVVNNTIVAKKLRYDGNFTLKQNWDYFNLNYGNFWGMIKLPNDFNPFTIIIAIFELLCFIYLVRKRNNRNFFLWIIFVFGWVKQIIFLSQKSLFDWYYWVPQILLFVPVIIFILEIKEKRNLWLSLFAVFYIVPMLAFQAVHSIATGNGEWNYRRHIGLYLDIYEKDKNQWILLEPAGYVPYFSHLKTIDEVGLVDKDIQNEIVKDKDNYWLNTVKKRDPKYLLSYKNLFTEKDSSFYHENYKLIKEFRIKDHLQSQNPLLEKIYRLKPSGTDYNLYEKIRK